jgi:hypothetical protein
MIAVVVVDDEFGMVVRAVEVVVRECSNVM